MPRSWLIDSIPQCRVSRGRGQPAAIPRAHDSRPANRDLKADVRHAIPFEDQQPVVPRRRVACVSWRDGTGASGCASGADQPRRATGRHTGWHQRIPRDSLCRCKNAEVDVPPQHWASLSLLSCDVPAIAMGSKKASGALLRVCEGRTLGVPPQRLRTEWSRLKPTRRRLKSCGPPPSHSRWRMCWLSLLHYTVWP